MLKEEVVVVVGGLVTERMTMGMLVPAVTERALMLTRMEDEVSMEQVELIVQEHVVVPEVRVI